MYVSDSSLRFIDFNQDDSCFLLTTASGFQIFNADPFRLSCVRDIEGGLQFATMLFRSQILFFMGDDPDKCLIWDDRSPPKSIAEMSFESPILMIKLRQDIVLIVLETQAFVYRLYDLHRFDSIPTCANPEGVSAVNSTNDRIVCALPGLQKGQVVVLFYRLDQSAADAQYRSKTVNIDAHEGAISRVALSADGSRLATCSEKGTLIRIFHTLNGNRLEEFRRGIDRADISCLTFHESNQWLVMASDKGTIHLFSLKNSSLSPGLSESSSNRKSKLSAVSRVLPYFGSQWSFAHYYVQTNRCICGFGQESNSILVLTAEGLYLKLEFDPNFGGEMTRLEQMDFWDRSHTQSLCASINLDDEIAYNLACESVMQEECRDDQLKEDPSLD